MVGTIQMDPSTKLKTYSNPVYHLSIPMGLTTVSLYSSFLHPLSKYAEFLKGNADSSRFNNVNW